MKALSPIGRLPRVTLSVQIAESMRGSVLSGEFRPGTQLNEVDLATRFGVSRGPLREAMQRLVQEGLLVSHPHRGVFVAALTEADLLDIYFVREAIEGAALRRIIASVDRTALHTRLATCIRRMATAVNRKDWVAVADCDFAFHRTLVETAASLRLSRMYDTVQAETKLCLHLLMNGYRSSADLVAEHQQLADLIRTGELPALLAALTRHLGDPVRALRNAGLTPADPPSVGPPGMP